MNKKIVVITLFAFFMSSCLATKRDLKIQHKKVTAEQTAKRKLFEEKMLQKVDTINARLRRIEDKLALNKIVLEKNKKAQENKINFSFNTLEELKSTIQELNNRIDTVDVHSKSLDTKVGSNVENMAEELNRLSKEFAELKKEVEATKPVEHVTIKEDGEIKLPDNRSKTYKELVKLTQEGTLGKTVRKAWKLYKKKFPDMNSCDVTYWTAESYYIEKNYPKAIEHFRKIDKKYKGCSKQEASYLRIAYALHYLGKDKFARKVVYAMKREFPKSSFRKQLRVLERKIGIKRKRRPKKSKRKPKRKK